MKKRSLLLGLIFLLAGLTASAQIVTCYTQGFEATGETYSYTVVSGTAQAQTSLANSGQRSLKISHTATTAVVVTDTIDLSANGNWHYFDLEFDHISNVNPDDCLSPSNVGIVEVKRIDQTNWTQLTSAYYAGGSDDYRGTGSVSYHSYSSWNVGAPTNTWWKHERFTLENVIGNSSQSARKIQVRFTLNNRTASSAADRAWYLDGLKVTASTASMEKPTLTLLNYPDLVRYPSSRGARITADFTAAGTGTMCNDSVYVLYKGGADPTVMRKRMNITDGHYQAYIPFYGYDTLVYYRVVGKDATVNHNAASYPVDEQAWAQFYCVRGVANESALASTLSNHNEFPFPSNGDMRSEFVYDSATLAAAGYGPGSVTSFQFTAGGSCNNSVHNHFRIYMANVETSYNTNTAGSFYTDNRKIVYDGTYNLSASNGSNITLNLQDTFFYAGGDILVQMVNDNTSQNPQALSIKHFPTATGKKSLYKSFDVQYSLDPMNDVSNYFTSGDEATYRPHLVFHTTQNLPLYYDCGISAFVTPSETNSANALASNNVQLTLKNFGENAIQAVRIWYQVDNGTPQYYDWTGQLTGGNQTTVTVSTTQNYTQGYHEMTAWVDDTVTSSGARYRDHEPLNDTCRTRFVACSGAMHGITTVGSPTSDYGTMDQFLFAVGQCGVDGPLRVMLAPGAYAPVTFTLVPGSSAANYIQFEPDTSRVGGVSFEPIVRTGATTTHLVNLQNSAYMRFKNISFVSHATQYPVSYMVRMGVSSVGCQFINCTFNEIAQSATSDFVFASALLYSGGADSLLVDGCTFRRGTIGVSLVGPASDTRATGNRVYRSYFADNGTNCVKVENQNDISLDSNYFDNVLGNSSYLLLLRHCYGSHLAVNGNKFYTSHGASCMGVTDFHGTSTGNAVIANNMLVCNDDGVANMMTTPMNIITADYTKVVFNAVKLTAPTRGGVAAATFGGGLINQCYFYNNIVACMDTVNYALRYVPNQGYTNYIGYNIYYSASSVMNQYTDINCANINAWRTHITDGNSQQVNPAFLNAETVDLRSYSQQVKAHGCPIAEVTVDMFDTIRNATNPCIGAFEFSALPYDFEIIEVLNPEAEYCNVPALVFPEIVIKNSGVNAYDPTTATSPLNVVFSVSPTRQQGTTSGVFQVTRTVPATDTIHFTLNQAFQFPTRGLEDTTYSIFAWTVSNIDPNPANDTIQYFTTSHYHAPAPDSLTVSVPYGTRASVTPTAGRQTWYSNVFVSGRTHKSALYWYTDPTSLTPIHRGDTLITDILYDDTTVYIRQKREMPLVKITEVQLFNNKAGVTSPMPSWMNTSTAFAVELTNVGDYPAEMLGDSLQVVGEVSGVYKFPNVTIQPGRSLVIQFRAGLTNVDSTITLGGSTISPTATKKFGVLYRDGAGIVDGVAFNAVSTNNNWNNAHVPTTVWSGAGITLDNFTAGVIRKKWPSNGNVSPSNFSQYWQLADSTHIMTIGATNTNLIRFEDNGCIGEVNPVHITITNRPNVDIALDSLSMPDGCGLGNEDVVVTINNYGSTNSGSLTVHYSINDTATYSDVIAAGVNGTDAITHTFSHQADLSTTEELTEFRIKVWVDQVTGDNSQFNDTTSITLRSMYRPGLPNVALVDTINYGTRDTLTALLPPQDSLLWYDRNMNALDTTNVFVTDYLYLTDTFYVTALGPREQGYHVGTFANSTSAGNYPSPYNPKTKYVREQYLYTADDLHAAGHQAGPIKSIAFHLDTIPSAAGSITFDSYTVGIGSTTLSEFANANGNWLTVQNVYSSSSLTISNAAKGWIRHEFNTPFQWDGTSNIVVEVCRSVPTAISTGARTSYTTATNKVITTQNANTSQCSVNTSKGSRGSNRPDALFGFVDYGCEGPAQMVTVVVVGTPQTDATIEWPASYDTMSFASCGQTDIDVVLRNSGLGQITDYTISYTIDGTTGSYTDTTSLATGQTATVTIAQHHFLPGRHSLQAVVSVTGDTVQTNDTINRVINVSFCAGTYVIGSAATADFPNFTVALDTLDGAGVSGPVVFSVLPGTYTEQLVIGEVRGMSPQNTVTFQSSTGNMGDVTLRYSTANQAAAPNYVLYVNGGSNYAFKNMTILARGLGNFSNAVKLENATNINFVGDNIRIKASIDNTNANCFVLGDNVNFIYIDSCVLDSGYCSITGVFNDQSNTGGIYVRDSRLLNYKSQGVNLKYVNNVVLQRNTIFSCPNINNRALFGVQLANIAGTVDVERNNVVMVDSKAGVKSGIVLSYCSGTNGQRVKVYNNMASVGGYAGTSQSVALKLSNCEFVNVYYNTTRVSSGTNTLNSRGFWVEGASSNIYVLNNIFTNFSQGYCYYIERPGSISSSNYNVYYSNLQGDTNFYYWGARLRDLAAMRTLSGMDNNSLYNMPYFMADTNLHLAFGIYSDRAQYSPEVSTDIDGTIRPQIPNPCIGAHEFEAQVHDISVMEILEPKLGMNPNNAEADTIRIAVKLYNNGTSTESNSPQSPLYWYATVAAPGYPVCRSENRTIAEIAPSEIIYDTAYIVMPIGIIDTQTVTVYFPLSNDYNPSDNTLGQRFFLDPAFNMTASVGEAAITTVIDASSGCRLQSTPLTITIRNVGAKAIPDTLPVTIGYQVRLKTTGITVPQFPITYTETIYLNQTANNPGPLAVNDQRDITFSQPANLYPTGVAKDINVDMRMWVSFTYDQKPENDTSHSARTSSWKQYSSKFTPSMPTGNDLHIPYATWDTIHMTQTDNPPTGSALHYTILWYRDSTAAVPFHPADGQTSNTTANYNRSCWWETPQYFHDSVYFVSCIGSNGCTSYYHPVHVYLNPRVSVDAAVSEIVEPYNKVYMKDDSVKVRIVNYGSQSISNIPVYYQVRRNVNNADVLQEVREVCRQTIMPDSSYVFTFDSLVKVPNQSWEYAMRAWTDLSSEMVRSNDTVREIYLYHPLAETEYCVPTVANNTGLDITRVAFNSLNHYTSPAGHQYINFGQYGTFDTNSTPHCEVLHVAKGATDTLMIEVTNGDGSADYSTGGYATVYIDYNRNGVFDLGEIVAEGQVTSRATTNLSLTIPDTSHYGYMRMRILVEQTGLAPVDPCTEIAFGNVQDYLLYVDRDVPVVDAALSRVAYPTNPILDSANNTISIIMTNKGSTDIESAEISYRYFDGHTNPRGSFTWTGLIGPGESGLIELPEHEFVEGTSNVRIIASVAGDMDSTNDTLYYQYHRFHSVTLILNDGFEGEDIWYAPRGYGDYNQNLWEKGTPNKPNLQSAYSGANAWVTQLGGSLNLGEKGSYSVLYTPLIDISQIRPDTISFYLYTNMAENSFLTMEYYNYEGKWITLGDANDTMWYNEGGGFQGRGREGGNFYQRYYFPVSKVSGELQQRLQFRFLYKALPGTLTNEGCALDSVIIGRARRQIDVGITRLTHPTHPRFGQTINPKVVLKNFGTDTIHEVTMAYRPYGVHLPLVHTWTGDLAPDESTIVEFDAPFTVMNDFPDTFQICAYTTVNMDIYPENDSVCQDFYLSPLDNDMGNTAFVYPLDRIVAGDSITVTVRLRNFGQAEVDSTEVSYIYNEFYTVNEKVDFNRLLGRPLQSFEFFDYTFRHRCRASMGMMHFTSIVHMDNDDYIYNDTITKTVDGIAAITDLKAKEIVVDTSSHTEVYIQLGIENIGARSANNFEVGFWYDNDTSTLVRETFSRDLPLAALSTGYYVFEHSLEQRAAAYDHVTAYVAVPGDNDNSNDTTSLIVSQRLDLRPLKVLVEENRYDTCHVRLLVENVGNVTCSQTRPLTMCANINGSFIRTIIYTTIEPGTTKHLNFDKVIPKSSSRTYEGTGYFQQLKDADTNNNRTNVVEVQNYFEGIPLVGTSNGVVLEQNYPNPFDENTRIDFYLPEGGNVRFFVMDQLGRLAYQRNDQYDAGDHSIDFKNILESTGVYYYGIEVNGERLMRKMVFKK